MSEDEVTADEVEQTNAPQQLRIPIPQIPVPLNMFFGVLQADSEHEVIFFTTTTATGGMLQGYAPPELAMQWGRDLLKQSRAADIWNSEHEPSGLILPTAAKAPLVVVGQS